MMRVIIADRSLARCGISHVFELEVDENLPVSNIIEKVEEKGVKGELVYTGKRLSSLADRLPADLNIWNDATIHVIPRTQGSSRSRRDQRDDLRESYRFDLNHHLNKHNSSANLSPLKEAAAEYGFDYDPHLIEPAKHLEWLAALEDYVFTNSELQLSSGVYEPENDSFDFFGHVNVPIQMLPQSNLACDRWDQLKVSASTTSGRSALLPVSLDEPVSQERIFLSFMKSYLILTRLIETFDNLVAQGFASSYFTFLLERPGADVAELVTVEREFLSTLQRSIEAIVKLLSDKLASTTQKEELDERIRGFLQPALVVFFSSLIGKPLPAFGDSGAFMPRLCRLTVLLCDLALLSYVGSHASRFDHRFTTNTEDNPYFVTRSQLDGVFSFRCDLRQLTCLDKLFDSRPVWVFRLKLDDGIELKENPLPLEPRLSIVTTIERLANVWGPVHAILNPENEKQIIQYVLGTGIIRRSKTSGEPSHKDAIRCHWEALSSIDNKPKLYTNLPDEPLSPDSFLSLDNHLLIGVGDLQQKDNPACTYNQEAFKKDYVDKLLPRGTKPSEWKIDGRGVNFSVTKIVSFGLSASQKLHPQIPVKESVWKEWTLTPKTANPLHLQANYGVEVSNCTGNSRRVPLKSFIQGKALQDLLELQFHGWNREPWGIAMLEALNLSDVDDAKPLLEFWKKYKTDREKVADLVAYVLGLLEDSGAAGSHFKAVLVAGYDALIVSIPRRLNDWASVLDNTWLTATYAAVIPCCMEYSKTSAALFSEMPCSECAQKSIGPSHTILHFQSHVYIAAETGFLRLKPSGKLFEIDRRASGDHTVVLTRASATSFPSTSSIQIIWETNFSHKTSYSKDIYICSKKMSYGGMALPRSKLRAMRNSGDTWQQPWNFQAIANVEQRQDQSDDNGSIWSEDDNSTVGPIMAEFGSESQQATSDSVQQVQYGLTTTDTASPG